MSRVTLGDVAIECRETLKGAKADYPTAGLEHLIPKQITLTTWGNGSDTTFSKVFRKGQVLFGRRRAYLKKAAVAPFDGLCSGDITVIEAKADLILPELLPFVIQNDAFFDYAVGKSAGSLSPRVKWEHLKKYEFELPDMDEQRKLAELLWSMVEAKEAYQELLQQTDELVKSRFIEMFDSVSETFAHLTLAETCDHKDDIKCGPFGTQLKQLEYTKEGIPIWGIPQVNSNFSIEPTDYVTPEKAGQLNSFSLCPGDIAMSRKGNVGQCAVYPESFTPGIIASDILRIRAKQEILHPVFLLHQLHLSEFVRTQILNVSNGVVMAGVNVTKLKGIIVYLPPMEKQEQFVNFVHQSDKAKCELEQSMKALEATYNKIISKNLG